MQGVTFPNVRAVQCNWCWYSGSQRITFVLLTEQVIHIAQPWFVTTGAVRDSQEPPSKVATSYLRQDNAYICRDDSPASDIVNG